MQAWHQEELVEVELPPLPTWMGSVGKSGLGELQDHTQLQRGRAGCCVLHEWEEDGKTVPKKEIGLK